MKPIVAAMMAAVMIASVSAAQAKIYTDENGEKVECKKVRVAVKKEWGAGGVAGTIIGGAAGGVIGHQIGGGRGKDLATGVGAVGGAAAGHEIGKGADTKYVYRERCHHIH